MHSKIIEIFKITETYLQEKISPIAALIDREPKFLQQALQEMGDRSLLGLKIAEKWGGNKLNARDYGYWQMTLARYSGALAFLQTQHQTAGALLSATDNQYLQETYLPKMVKGEILLGVGFSQLRRLGTPTIKAIPTIKGYHLDGKVPWVTGFGFFQEFIIGATLPNGEVIYAIIPFQETRQNSGGKISFSAPLCLAAISATNTVSANVNQWLLKKEYILSIKSADDIHQKDKENILNPSFLALGCARAGLDILQQIYEQKKLLFLQETWINLDEQLNCCCREIENILTEKNCFSEKLRLRTRSINLAGRCAQAAVIASGGKANYLDNPAQRVYREALLFTISGQTTAVMEATLKQLHQ